MPEPPTTSETRTPLKNASDLPLDAGMCFETWMQEQQSDRINGFTLCHGWMQRLRNVLLWYAEQDSTINVLVDEDYSTHRPYAQTNNDQLTRITEATAEYNTQKLARLLQHRILQLICTKKARSVPEKTAAQNYLRGTVDAKVQSIDPYVSEPGNGITRSAIRKWIDCQ
jgi:hypothetical protein